MYGKPFLFFFSKTNKTSVTVDQASDEDVYNLSTT